MMASGGGGACVAEWYCLLVYYSTINSVCQTGTIIAMIPIIPVTADVTVGLY